LTSEVLKPPRITLGILFIATAILILIRLPSALTPSGADDWDSISHQMAMGKIWLQHGHVDYIPFMHQSNIPATTNMLYMVADSLGGQYAAKTIAFFLAIFATMAIGGLASMRYGKKAGWWAALAFVATPVVLWEVGTAYVDVAHGAYTGLAILFAAMALEGERPREPETEEGLAGASPSNYWTLCGLCLGFSMGTKYTGIQTAIAILLLVIGSAFLFRKSQIANRKSIALAALLAIVIASPWYIRNYVNTGNPVYPFFYSVFGGRNWSQENADHYADEQRTFGIGQKISQDGNYEGKDPLALPGSVTALALQPDKQINLGTPWGAIGPLFVLGLLWWPFSRRVRRFEGTIIVTVLISLVAWFFLSQQSRYIIGLVVPAAFLLGGAAVRSRLGKLAAFAILAQTLYTLWLFALSPISNVQEQVALLAGGNADEYLTRHLPFWEATKELNRIGKAEPVKVALYDEVRGYYLDVDYWWANPGHSRIIEYEKLQNSEDLVTELKRTGTTHVYMNFAFLGDQGWELRHAFFPEYFSQPLGMEGVQDFRRLLVEAWKRGDLELIDSFGAQGAAPPQAVLLQVKR
jgi:hypothetical protein